MAVEFPSFIVGIMVILVFALFLLTFAFMAISLFRWIKTPICYERIPAIKPEEYACPKCGSKELEPIGRRTLRCRKCGTTFTIRTGAAEVYWAIWPFLPIIWWWNSTKD
ncbi:MAG: hypothetical protein RMJ15_06625 [Nitrososphaerota archaeon]|nr:hypothetical protein [Nitrososphaerota archaeon]